MKKLLLLACTILFSMQAMTQDTIRLTLKATSSKAIYVRATQGTNNITIDWGDGNILSYDGDSYNSVPMYHSYSSTNSYDVVVATPDANTTLTYFSCTDNYLTALDVSGATALTFLDCSSNQLTALDVSMNTALIDLFCDENQLTALDVSTNTALTWLDCSDNGLTLSQLYPIWINKGITSHKELASQIFYGVLMIDEAVDLSSEMEFGNPAAETKFVVCKGSDGTISAEGSYTFENGLFTFTEAGFYRVFMQNDSVRSGNMGIGNIFTVMAHYYVREIGTNANLTNLSLSEGELQPIFSEEITEYTVNVANSISSITLNATPKDKNATITGVGTEVLEVGENIFNIVVVAEDGIATQTYTVTVIRAEYVSITEVEKTEAISVYPNPTTGQLTIESASLRGTKQSREIIEKVEIYNISGKKLSTINTKHSTLNSQEIDLSHLVKGIYILRINDEQMVKVIKE